MLPTGTTEATRNLLLGLLFASFPFTQAIGAPQRLKSRLDVSQPYVTLENKQSQAYCLVH
jgi:hypothetical protein